jgi:putative hydrolase of HD superfamily
LDSNDSIAKYAYEMGHLKNVTRAGWTMLGIPNAESVAEHSFRTAILGYILASLAGADAQKTATMCLFHDTAESRTGDPHRVARRYSQQDDELALSEQVERLPVAMAEEILSLVNEYEQRLPVEGQLARDADLLECILQAREYQTHGFEDTQDWIDNCYASLKSKEARELADACLRTEPKAWWQGLKVKR